MPTDNGARDAQGTRADQDDAPAFDGTLVRDVCRAIEAAGYPQLTAGQFAGLACALHDVLYPQRAEDRDLADALADVYGLGFTAGQRQGAASMRRQPSNELDAGLVDRMRTQVDLLVTTRLPIPGHPITEEQRKRATALGVALVQAATAYGVNGQDLGGAANVAATALDAIRLADRRSYQPDDVLARTPLLQTQDR